MSLKSWTIALERATPDTGYIVETPKVATGASRRKRLDFDLYLTLPPYPKFSCRNAQQERPVETLTQDMF